ncbi:endo-1,4-beta-xylanase [bacterium]|nr:endo-1,4-beta-xylanase [bacterium]
MKNASLLISLLLIIGNSCTKPKISACDTQNNKLHFKFDFPIGVAVDHNKLFFQPEYAELSTSQFNSFTAENAMKMSQLQPLEGQFFFDDAEAILDLAVVNRIQIHGHTLVWHNQIPNWLENFEGTQRDWEELLKKHIQTVVGHFKGRIESWDVVNEAFEEDGSLRKSIWLEHIGPDYIIKAFQWAKEVDPDALLFYNDFNLALNEKKRKKVIQYFTKAAAQGLQIDGIGMQMHINTSYPTTTEIGNCITEIWQAGFKVHISELDISINHKGDDIAFPGTEALKKQADKAYVIFKLYQNLPPEFQHGITFWGLRDNDSWIPSTFNRTDFPLLFDREYRPKPIYCKLIQSL